MDTYASFNCEWKSKGLAATLARAEDFGVSAINAISTRIRYIAQQLVILNRKVWACERQAERLGIGPNPYRTIADFQRRVRGSELNDKLGEIIKERNSLLYEKDALEQYLSPKKRGGGLMTEAMIEAAANYPIGQLLEGPVRGNMVCCPFHKDDSPSASIRNNRLYCFAGCRPKKGDKSTWGPISLLMERDGLTFPAAVRYLTS